MSQKTFKSTENKRAVDLGKVTTGLTSDLIKVWRTSTGEEKAISLGDINGGLIGDYVPYTGAVDDVDLGEKGLSTGYIKYDTTPTATPTDQGTSYWDVDDNTLAIIMNGTTLKVGEDQYYPVKNQTGVLIPKGTAVRFAGTLGSSGRLLIAPFLADGSLPSSRFMGVTSEDIGNGEDGKVMWFGRIRGINTNAFNEGDILYASTTVAGGFQTTVPTPPNNIVEVCAVIHKGASNGIIFVRPSFITSVQAGAGLSLDSLNQIQLGNDGAYRIDYSSSDTDFEIFSSQNDILSGYDYSSILRSISGDNNMRIGFLIEGNSEDSGLGLEFNSQISAKSEILTGAESVMYVADQDNFIRLKINNLSGSTFTDNIFNKGLEYPADYSANWTDHSLVTKSWVLGQVSGSAHNPVTIGSPANGLSISGTQVLTIGLASTSATGALSSTDWNTFNGKLNLTSPITGYTVGSNTTLAATDTILQAFGKVQGQINARISGTISSGQVAFGTGVNTVGGSNNLFWDSVNNRLGVNTNTPSSRLEISSTNESLRISGKSSANIVNDLYIVRSSSGTGIFSGPNIRLDDSTLNNNIAIQNSQGQFGIWNFSTGSWVQRIVLTNTNLFGVLTPSPTNTLDVNGTARIRTISNLGSAATSVLVPSATGVLSLRTLAELSADMGNAWTSVGSGNIFRNSRISVGHTGDPVESIDLGTAGWLRVANGQNAGGGIIFPFSSSDANSRSWSIGSDHGSAFGQLILRRSDTQSGNPRTGTITLGIDRGGNVAINGSPFFNSNFTYFDVYGRSINESGVLRLFTSDSNRLFQTYINSGTCISETNSTTPWSFRIGTNEAFRIATSRNVLIGTAVDLGFRFYVAGTTAFQGLVTFQENVVTDIAFGTTVGTKIGTATNQRLAFWNATPIVQPTTAVASGTLVSNAGTTITNTDTIDGYTLQQVVRALRNTGLLA